MRHEGKVAGGLGRRASVKTVGLGVGSLALGAPGVAPAPLAPDGASPLLTDPEWPSLRHYDADHLARIALPIGGIGTGTLSPGGRGDLRDFETMNRPCASSRWGSSARLMRSP